MKLSQSQIQYLDNYVQKSGIKWFDLKIELTDHMIGKTEEILTRIPDLDFEEAVKKAKLTFGSKGFRPIILEKTKQIERQFYKDVFMHFKSFFTIPKIIITVLITLFLFGLYQRKKLKNNLSLTLSHMLQFSTLINSMAIFLNFAYSIFKNDLVKGNNYVFFISIWLVMFLIALSIENVSKKIYANQKRMYYKYL